jgi:hypothetical protein
LEPIALRDSKDSTHNMSDNENDETNTSAATTPITIIDLVGDEAMAEQESVEEEEGESDNVFQSIESAFEPNNIGNLTRKRPRLETAENDDDAAQCSICFDQWTQLGSHRVVSLVCGHLFGDR